MKVAKVSLEYECVGFLIEIIGSLKGHSDYYHMKLCCYTYKNLE